MTPELKRYSIRQSVVNDCEVCTWEEDRLGAFVSFDDAQEVMRQARAEALEEAAKIFDGDDFFVAEQIRALKQPAEGEE